MTLEDARRVAACASAVNQTFYHLELLGRLRQTFPEFRWIVDTNGYTILVDLNSERKTG